MTAQQIAVLLIIVGTLALFVWDRWRYDVVALTALLASVLAGVVPADRVFSGFADPVVTTVVAVLILSSAIRNSGMLEVLLARLSPYMERQSLQVAIFAGLVTAFSAFMNNVGALALFLPLAVQTARKSGHPPSQLLMPLSFGSLLGGLITLIGTPPNLLISNIRAEHGGTPYSMFDFAPVGLGIAIAGVAFLAFGWRILPKNRQGKPTPDMRFEITDYTTELAAPAGTPMVGKTVAEFEAFAEDDAAVVGIVRGGVRRLVPSGRETIRAEDVLVVESDPATLKQLVDRCKLALVGQKDLKAQTTATQEIGIAEAVVMAGSPLKLRTLSQLRLRDRFGVNLLAVSRGGSSVRQRLSRLRFEEGDVVVLQGNTDLLPETLQRLGCLPLAERALQLGRPRRAWAPFLAMGLAVAANALGLLPIHISFLAAVLAIVLTRSVLLSEAYAAIDWPVIVLLGAMIPVTEAMQETGVTELIAGQISGPAAFFPKIMVVALVMIATMAITPVLNNAATVLVMAPIAVDIAGALGIGADAVLMAVAVGASSDFLTPIGHQSNTLVMGPGGYRFADYWRLGLPLSLIVVAMGVPLIALVWGIEGR